MSEPIVVVGAGAAGVTVVDALRREGFTGRIVLVGDEPHPPYDRPPLSKGFLLGAVGRSSLALREAPELDRLRVELRLGREAVGLDLATRRLELDDGARLEYDRLVIATGVSPRAPGRRVDDDDVRLLRTVDDAQRIRSEMRDARRIAVIGGGLLGYEIAATARSSGCDVVIVDRRTTPLEHPMGPVVGPMIARLHRDRGVEIHHGAGVSDIVAAGSRREVRLDDGTSVVADLVVAAVGSTPNVTWLRSSGLDVVDGVLCDANGRAAPGVYAAGDVARWRTASARATRVEHRTNATEQGVAVARHIVHGIPAPPTAPYFWSDQYDTRIQVCGSIHSRPELRVVAGDPAEGRFVMGAYSDDRLVGVVGWRMAKDFARHRALVMSPGY